MNRKVSHFRLGVFVLVAIVILIALIVSVGGGNMLRKEVTMETYFDESVQGLDVGSKVRYRGVVIGAVSNISFTYTKYEQDRAPAERKQYVLVEMAVYPDLLGKVGGGQNFVDRLVEDGLRIRMAPVGVTGIVYLELDFARKNDVLPISWVPDHLYIPSTHSTVTNFVDAVERFMAKLAPINLEQTAGNLERLLTTLNRKADALDTERISREMGGTLAELRKVAQDLGQLTGSQEWKSVPADVSASARRLREITDSPELKRTLAALDRSTQRIDHALDGRERDISELIVNLRAVSANLKTLSENLRRDPAGTLLSNPPPTNAYTPK